MRPVYISLLFVLPLALGSCKKWLDVQPKTQVSSEAAFRDEQGFKDALTGVYVALAGNDLYGKELTFGLVDVLGKQYTRFPGTSVEYYYPSRYDYLNDSARTKITAVWRSGYRAIANINNLIGNLRTANQALFTDANYSIIKGEAYGLRAMVHFDLLRLFAPAPASPGGNDATGIPYVTDLAASVTVHSKVKDVIAKVLADLDTAASALKTVDPIMQGSTTPATTTGYLRDRYYKFNYYAVKALQARVYLYHEEKEKALTCAEEVITSGVFGWTPLSQIQASLESDRNKVFTQELIFSLYISNQADIASTYFLPTSTNLLTKSTDAEFVDVYEDRSDVRYFNLTSEDATATLLRYPIKLTPSGWAAYNNKMPLLRKSELYYIAAEAVRENDPAKAMEYINEVRRNRNLSDLSVSPDQVQNEIFKEYRKEFLCEGQLFFYYKRLNLSSIAYAPGVVADNTVYVLPIPDDEIEFGNR